VHEYLFVFAPGVLECVCENRHRTEVARVVHLPRDGNGGVGAPSGIERHRAEPVLEDVAHKCTVFVMQFLLNALEREWRGHICRPFENFRAVRRRFDCVWFWAHQRNERVRRQAAVSNRSV
jgi:hypothetical protein